MNIKSQFLDQPKFQDKHEYTKFIFLFIYLLLFFFNHKS
jgi:hypothetical protein